MRSSQWSLIGIFLILMGIWFVSLDNVWRGSCDVFDDSPLTKADIIACVNGEILDPFIWLLHPLGIVFLICSFIELRAEKRKK